MQRSSGLGEDAIRRALGKLAATVREKSLKHSDVRDLIARTALQQEGHFSVIDLLRELREKGHGDVSSATVYRVLPLLVDAGLVQSVLVSLGDSTRYERTFEREHHDHLICIQCEKVVEFQFEAIELLQKNIADGFGFDLTGHTHELLGVCPECRASRTTPGQA